MHLFRVSGWKTTIVAIATLLLIVNASPTSKVGMLEAPKESLTTAGINLEYQLAWQEVTGSIPTNLLPANGSTAPDKRAILPWNGQNSYVAFAYHNGRWVISLVVVLNAKKGLADGLTSTTNVASVVADNARHVMGAAQGLWSSTSWSFYSNVVSHAAFTVVAKNLMPKKTTYTTARAAAVALAAAYGLNQNPAYPLYPKNSRRIDEVETPEFSMLASFQPTEKLVELLRQKFHYQEFRNGTTTVGEIKNREMVEKRTGHCSNYNERSRVVWNYAPIDTEFDTGCLGSESDFGRD